ncbi:hypothetical protein VB780_08100 [Leptolyngbya sp. CCNP1308]|uniref:hypothetical protein n=1 Tax=Leptolyngbya sp. CCNP1308 TaxID=3110255 RepID=UPI002B20FFAB|nr:hypothetical protein [Leptolyngbya sp. CCNP1308]MEA5448523.1 hypothetical protein [Leptolyngbya sp. CCNP1308]
MNDRYNYPRADYPLLQAIRLRRSILSWGLGLTAWSLLLASTLIAEEHDNRLHWIRTGLIAATLPIAALGRLGVEDSVKAGRAALDYEDVTDAGRQQILWQETTDQVAAGSEVEAIAPVELVEAWDYLGRAAREWRSHLLLLSPTDTGKSSFLYLLLGAQSRAREVVLQAIEGKGGVWPGVPAENIVRIAFRPSLNDAHALCYRLHKTLDLIQARVDQGQWEGPQLVSVVEEYLALSSTFKKRGDAYRPYGLSLELSVEATAAVARGGGGQLVLVSQSPNADDLKFSGGIRSNFRVACLGSKLGGFEAIERMIDNPSFVNKRDRERIEGQYQAARGQLNTERHPLVLTNLLGEWQCFPMPYLTEAQLAQLSIKSLPAPPELLVDDGWLPGGDIATPGGSMPAKIQRPKAGPTIDLDLFPGLDYDADADDSPPDSEPDSPISLEAIENMILEVLAGATEPLKGYEIKSKRRPLRRVDQAVFNRVLLGLVQLGGIVCTDEETPRYTLPPG